MSRGYYGRAKLNRIEDTYVEYFYSGENWNSSNSVEGDALLFDGIIKISLQGKLIEVDSCKNDFDRCGEKFIARKLVSKIIRLYREYGEWIREVEILL